MIWRFVLFAALLWSAVVQAQPAAWDTTFGAPGVVYATSGGIANRSVSGAGLRTMVAVDYLNKRMCVFAPNQAEWTSFAGGSNFNIASATCYDLSTFGTSSMAIALQVGQSGASGRLHTGSTIQGLIPSGYTSYDTACGTTVTLQPSGSQTGSDLTFSDGNTTATATGNSNAVATTCSLALGSNNKIVVELEVPPSTGGTWGNYYQVGLVNSSWVPGATSNIAADTSTARAYWSSSCCAPGINSQQGLGEGGSDNRTSGLYSQYYRSVRANKSSSSNVVWEITVTTITGGGNIGVMDGTPGPIYPANSTRDFGGTANGIVISSAGGCFSNASAIGTCSTTTWTTSDVIMFAYKGTTNELWWKIGGTWYGSTAGTPDPATGANGLPLTTVTSITAPVYPAVSVYASNGTTPSGATFVINGGATAFTNAVPSGFVPLDGAPSRPGARGYIYGANDNDACTWLNPYGRAA